ncbi:MAG: hypothetical protein AB7E42_11240 [Anaerotignaceae bacterium]
MQKKNKNILLELFFYIVFSVLILIAIEIFNTQNNKFIPYQLVYAAIFNVIVCILIGMYINSINRNISFKNFKFNISRFLIFIGCLIVIVLLWAFYGYLPKIITSYFTIVHYLISIYAGANLLSALFDIYS